jgi:hypothetical protein
VQYKLCQNELKCVKRRPVVIITVTADSTRLRVVVYDVKTGVVVDGCVRRLEVVDPWRSCGGGCLCVHTYSSDSTEMRRVHPVWRMLCIPLWGSFELLSRKLHWV